MVPSLVIWTHFGDTAVEEQVTCGEQPWVLCPQHLSLVCFTRGEDIPHSRVRWLVWPVALLASAHVTQRRQRSCSEDLVLLTASMVVISTFSLTEACTQLALL